MQNKLNKEQQGFTIVELMISTAVFSLLLVGLLSSLVKISDMFYKGISMSKTQEDARNIVQSISDDIQFSATAPANIYADSSNNQTGVFCIGNHRYSFNMGVQDNGSNNIFTRDTVGGGGCPNVGTVSPDQPLDPTTTIQMLDPSMQLNALTVNCINDRCNVKIHLIFYGGHASGLFNSQCSDASNCFPGGVNYPQPELAPDAQCTGSIESADLCAVVDYDSTVLKQ